jgi:DNA-binding NarL/FixJ family response regulator
MKKELTRRELQVLKLLGEGNSVKVSASILDLSVKTIEAHKFNLMRKLDIHNRAHLTIYAIEHKLVKLKPSPVEPSKSVSSSRPTEAKPK